MYPQPELTPLARRKQELVRRIRGRRLECARHIATVMKPVAWVDGARAKWRAVSPLAKLAAAPAGWLLARTLAPRLGGLVAWAPVAWKLLRAMR